MMNTNQILVQFDNLQRRIELLVQQLNDSEKKLETAENELQLLRTSLKQQELNLKNLQKNQGNQQKDFQKREFFSKLVQNTGGISGDSSELKKALDNYIKEIESCIAQLSN